MPTRKIPRELNGCGARAPGPAQLKQSGEQMGLRSPPPCWLRRSRQRPASGPGRPARRLQSEPSEPTGAASEARGVGAADMRFAAAPRQANPAEQRDQCEDLITRINERTGEVLLWVRVDGITRGGHRIRVCVKLPNLAVAEAVLQEGRDGIIVESHAVQDIRAS